MGRTKNILQSNKTNASQTTTMQPKQVKWPSLFSAFRTRTLSVLQPKYIVHTLMKTTNHFANMNFLGALLNI
ncbi:hypothetical protein V6Z11_A08G136900 [Gossypium hirsutum]